MNRIAACIAAAIATICLLVPFAAIAGQEVDARANQLPLRFKDANGKVLGRAVWGAADEVPFVVMQEGKFVFALNLASNGPDKTLFDFYSDILYFESADCSTQGYVPAMYKLSGMRTSAVVLPPDGSTLIYVGSGYRTVVNIKSYRLPDSSCRASDYPNFYGDPLDAILDVSGKYQAPFSIR